MPILLFLNRLRNGRLIAYDKNGEVNMFEMLGNQLFLVRNYSRATEIFEKALWEDPRNKYVRRKLIICYTQIGELDKALKNLLWFLKKDIRFIIDIDPVAEDCPCSGLVYEMEAKLTENRESSDFHVILGILWLYCNIERSLSHFLTARELAPANPDVKSAIAYIQAYLDQSKRDSKTSNRDKNNVNV
jgi:tetratricopeptide (TPR) repeat protein